MTKDQVKTVLDRVPSWPQERQQELAELALEIEAELAGGAYHATSDELQAIDEGLAGEAASEEDVKTTFEARADGALAGVNGQRLTSRSTRR